MRVFSTEGEHRLTTQIRYWLALSVDDQAFCVYVLCRLTGSIHAFDFSVVSELDTQDLPSICYSNYDEPTASSYRVDLAVPYDQIS